MHPRPTGGTSGPSSSGDAAARLGTLHALPVGPGVGRWVGGGGGGVGDDRAPHPPAHRLPRRGRPAFICSPKRDSFHRGGGVGRRAAHRVGGPGGSPVRRPWAWGRRGRVSGGRRSPGCGGRAVPGGPRCLLAGGRGLGGGRGPGGPRGRGGRGSPSSGAGAAWGGGDLRPGGGEPGERRRPVVHRGQFCPRLGGPDRAPGAPPPPPGVRSGGGCADDSAGGAVGPGASLRGRDVGGGRRGPGGVADPGPASRAGGDRGDDPLRAGDDRGRGPRVRPPLRASSVGALPGRRRGGAGRAGGPGPSGGGAVGTGPVSPDPGVPPLRGGLGVGRGGGGPAFAEFPPHLPRGGGDGGGGYGGTGGGSTSSRVGLETKVSLEPAGCGGSRGPNWAWPCGR